MGNCYAMEDYYYATHLSRQRKKQHVLLTLTGMQNMINRRSAVAKPPRKTFVGVAGSGLSRGQRVEAMITTFPARNITILFSVKELQYLP